MSGLFGSAASEVLAQTLNTTTDASNDATTTATNVDSNALTTDTFSDRYDVWTRQLEEHMAELTRSGDFNSDATDERFSTSLPLDRVRDMSVAIVGAGGLGNWQWRILLGMGFRVVSIFDDDVVGLENIGPQAHQLCDLGLPKVEAVRRAGIAWRGVEITARNHRVNTLGDIEEALGYMPKVVITCTDSAEFRNNFIKDIKQKITESDRAFPELLFDFRMSLGDWTCYIIPLHRIYHKKHTDLLDMYVDRAVFPPDEAVQEPCTERAIVYTGASAATFTGSYLHWWLTGGKRQAYDNTSGYFHLEDTTLLHHWTVTHSSRDWESIQPTRREIRLEQRLSEAKEDRAKLRDGLVQVIGSMVGLTTGHIEEAFFMQQLDVHLSKYDNQYICVIDNLGMGCERVRFSRPHDRKVFGLIYVQDSEHSIIKLHPSWASPHSFMYTEQPHLVLILDFPEDTAPIDVLVKTTRGKLNFIYRTVTGGTGFSNNGGSNVYRLDTNEWVLRKKTDSGGYEEFPIPLLLRKTDRMIEVLEEADSDSSGQRGEERPVVPGMRYCRVSELESGAEFMFEPGDTPHVLRRDYEGVYYVDGEDDQCINISQRLEVLVHDTSGENNSQETSSVAD